MYSMPEVNVQAMPLQTLPASLTYSMHVLSYYAAYGVKHHALPSWTVCATVPACGRRP